MRSTFVLTFALVACAQDPVASSVAGSAVDPVVVEGTVSDSMDVDVAVEDFRSSGAMWGLVVDPETGDEMMFQNTDRAVNSNDYTLLAGQCLDCNVGCGGSDARELRFDFQLNAATPAMNFQIIGLSNYTFGIANCAVNGNGFNGGSSDTCPRNLSLIHI